MIDSFAEYFKKKYPQNNYLVDYTEKLYPEIVFLREKFEEDGRFKLNDKRYYYGQDAYDKKHPRGGADFVEERLFGIFGSLETGWQKKVAQVTTPVSRAVQQYIDLLKSLDSGKAALWLKTYDQIKGGADFFDLAKPQKWWEKRGVKAGIEKVRKVSKLPVSMAAYSVPLEKLSASPDKPLKELADSKEFEEFSKKVLSYRSLPGLIPDKLKKAIALCELVEDYKKFAQDYIEAATDFATLASKERGLPSKDLKLLQKEALEAEKIALRARLDEEQRLASPEAMQIREEKERKLLVGDEALERLELLHVHKKTLAEKEQKQRDIDLAQTHRELREALDAGEQGQRDAHWRAFHGNQ